MNPSNDNVPDWYTPPAVPFVSPDCVQNVLSVIEQVERDEQAVIDALIERGRV